MNKEQIAKLAQLMAAKINQAHAHRKTWDKSIGQWLVYGFEKKIGFGAGVELESKVESAYRTRLPVEPVIAQFFTEFCIKTNQLVNH